MPSAASRSSAAAAAAAASQHSLQELDDVFDSMYLGDVSGDFTVILEGLSNILAEIDLNLAACMCISPHCPSLKASTLELGG